MNTSRLKLSNLDSFERLDSFKDRIDEYINSSSQRSNLHARNRVIGLPSGIQVPTINFASINSDLRDEMKQEGEGKVKARSRRA